MEEQKTEVIEDSEKKVHAKSVSLWGQIIASLWIIGWSCYKFITATNEIKINDIIFSGFAVAGCFTPVYFNLIMDKIKDIKLGN